MRDSASKCTPLLRLHSLLPRRRGQRAVCCAVVWCAISAEMYEVFALIDGRGAHSYTANSYAAQLCKALPPHSPGLSPVDAVIITLPQASLCYTVLGSFDHPLLCRCATAGEGISAMDDKKLGKEEWVNMLEATAAAGNSWAPFVALREPSLPASLPPSVVSLFSRCAQCDLELSDAVRSLP